MRKFITLALATAAAGMAFPLAANAQYYDPYGREYYRRPPPPPPGYYRPRPDYGYGGGYGGGGGGYGYGGGGYGGGYGRARYSAMCVTSRGTCSSGQPLPVGTNCRCNIPGFGPKRGAIGG